MSLSVQEPPASDREVCRPGPLFLVSVANPDHGRARSLQLTVQSTTSPHTAHSSQSTAHSPQLAAHSPQPTAHRPQPIAHNSQPTAHSSAQPTAHRSQPAAHSSLQPTAHSSSQSTAHKPTSPHSSNSDLY